MSVSREVGTTIREAIKKPRRTQRLIAILAMTTVAAVALIVVLAMFGGILLVEVPMMV
jgi:predicted nucleic acid-binding Zn ribbon protein